MDAQMISPARTGSIDKMLFFIAGADPDLLSLCPEHDRQVMRALGALLIANWCYEACLLYKIATLCSGSPSEFQPQSFCAAIGLASFVLAIDSFCIFRSHWWRAGLAQLAVAGLRIENGFGPRLHAGFFFMVRFCLASGLALLTGLFFGLIIYASDIGQRLHADYLRKNEQLIANAARLVDGPLVTAREAVKSQSARVDDLSHQVAELRDDQIDDPGMRQAQQEVARLTARQEQAQDALRAAEATASNEIGGIKGDATSGRPGGGPRRRAAMEQANNARRHAGEINRDLEAARARLDRVRAAAGRESSKRQYRDALPHYESAMVQEEVKLAGLKEQLAILVARREADIQGKLESSADYVPQETGLLSQLAALDALTRENPNIRWTIMLIELCAFGFELASVLAVASAVPTCYAAMRVRESYLHDAEIAGAVMEVLHGSARKRGSGADRPAQEAQRDGKSENVAAAPGPSPFVDPGIPPQPVKRPRGRPRKTAA